MSFHSTHKQDTSISTLSNNNNNNKSFKALKLERKKERTKTVSNRVNEKSYDILLDILRKEKMQVGDWLQDQIDEYSKVHGDGNPVYTLDHFNDESFLATPAYHRPLHAWESYLKKCPDNEYREWTAQLESLLNLERRMTKLR